MNSKQRVLTTLANKEADRVPINYFANPNIDGRLKKHFGLEENDAEGLCKALGVDFRNIETPFVGTKKHDDIPERGTVDSCKETLDIMMPGGGYCFAPTHQLQDNSPTENVVAMYETAREYGKY